MRELVELVPDNFRGSPPKLDQPVTLYVQSNVPLYIAHCFTTLLPVYFSRKFWRHEYVEVTLFFLGMLEADDDSINLLLLLSERFWAGSL